MEKIIDQLRQISNWDQRPDGFSGACLLANSSDGAAKLLLSFLKELEPLNKPWLRTVLKNCNWYK